MAFDITGKLPLYAGIALTIRLTNPGSATRVNGSADDAFVDSSSNFQFVATVAEDLVGTFDYVVFSGSQPVEVGTVYRATGQAVVLLGSVAPGSSGSVVLTANYPTVSRNVTDETPILFTWPSASVTIAVTRSIDAGSYGAATGGATFAYTQDGQHFYSLAYSANDRPAGAGSVVYRLNDGTVVRLLPLQVEVGGGGGGDEETILAIKAKTDLITSQTSNQLTLPSTTLSIIRGDSFSQSVPVTTNYTGYTATFTIRHRVTNAILVTTSATVASSTALTVSLTTTQTAFTLLVDPTEFGPHPYDIQLVSGAITKTEKGVAIIKRDVTP